MYNAENRQGGKKGKIDYISQHNNAFPTMDMFSLYLSLKIRWHEAFSIIRCEFVA